MKKFATILMLFVVIGMNVSCEKKATPEEEVRNYGKYFVEKINANQLDSLTVSFPDISKADSIVPIKTDSIMVAEVAQGQFDLTLAEGIILKINRSEDGNISVTESKGLFAFPTDKVDIAKKTGMWDDNLSDAQLNERMKDEEFFAYLNEIKTVKTSDILKISQKNFYIEIGPVGDQKVINLTDKTIEGSEYSVVMKRASSFLPEGIDKVWTTVELGKTIPPHGSVKYDIIESSHSLAEINSIKWNLTPEQLQEKFAPFTGNEYQEYLNSKK